MAGTGLLFAQTREVFSYVVEQVHDEPALVVVLNRHASRQQQYATCASS